jgi:hypothetical protein
MATGQHIAYTQTFLYLDKNQFIHTAVPFNFDFANDLESIVTPSDLKSANVESLYHARTKKE